MTSPARDIQCNLVAGISLDSTVFIFIFLNFNDDTGKVPCLSLAYPLLAWDTSGPYRMPFKTK